MPNYNETANKLKSFARLPAGWHYGEGVTPSERNIHLAGTLLHTAKRLGFGRFNAFPGIEGEVQITIYDGQHFFQFTIEPNGETTVVQEIDREEVDREEYLSFPDAINKLESFAFELCDMSESFTPVTLTKSTSVLPTSLSKTPVKSGAVASQSSSMTVPSTAVVPSASTSKIFTAHLGETLSSIGSYRTILSSLVASGNPNLATVETSAITT